MSSLTSPSFVIGPNNIVFEVDSNDGVDSDTSGDSESHWLITIQMNVLRAPVDADETMVIVDAVDNLRHEITRRLRTFNPRYYMDLSDDEILRSVNVQAYVLNSAMSHAASDSFSPAIDELTPERYSSLWKQLFTSNATDDVFKIHFGVRLQQATIMYGRGARSDRHGLKQLVQKYCLATSLFLGTMFFDNSVHMDKSKMIRGGKKLADMLGMQESESVDSIKSKFLVNSQFSHHRVIVMIPHGRKILPDKVYFGRDYEYLPSMRNRVMRDANSIYLEYDAGNCHFNFIDYPLSYLRQMTGKDKVQYYYLLSLIFYRTLQSCSVRNAESLIYTMHPQIMKLMMVQ